MNLLWVTFSLSFLLHWVRSAPAVSSVHVSFVSGNQATEYSHGIGGSSPLAHYNLVGSPSKRDEIGESHLKRKRSIFSHGGPNPNPRDGNITPTHDPPTTSTFGTLTTPKITKKHQKYLARPPINPKFGRKYHTSTTTTSTTTLNNAPIVTPTFATTTTTVDPHPSKTTSSQSPLMKRMLRSRVKFVEPPRPTSSGVDDNTVTGSGGSLLSTPTTDILKGESTKPKDSKAVKRSPELFGGENFDAGGIQFPDFDDFGGEEFGSLKNFAGGHGGGRGRGGGGGRISSVGAHTHANPESLSPDGVFLPPLPTEASDYADSDRDPYLADPDTANYAAQHPPFFAAFPHKRSVLALNEQRVHNGLEPNILRSIRPYFAFFDAANPYPHGKHYIEHKIPYDHGNEVDLQYENEHPPPHPGVPPPISYSHSETSNSNFFDRLGTDYLKPNHLLYTESDILRTKPVLTSWSIFTKRK